MLRELPEEPNENSDLVPLPGLELRAFRVEIRVVPGHVPEARVAPESGLLRRGDDEMKSAPLVDEVPRLQPSLGAAATEDQVFALWQFQKRAQEQGVQPVFQETRLRR